MAFKDIWVPDCEHTTAPTTGEPVFQVNTPHGLTQAAGYLKYVDSRAVYFRGQRTLYGSLTPTLFRGLPGPTVREARHRAVRLAIADYVQACPILSGFGSYAHEPLLQHYGLNTTWIDVIDNVWVALWFACHRAKCTSDGKFLHFERLSPFGSHQHVYVLLIAADVTYRRLDKPGYWHGKDTELVDLRQAVPSVFLRPHAQHGLLFRRKGDPSGKRWIDYSTQIVGTIQIRLTDALTWLGEGKSVNFHALFPPAYYDSGYKILVEASVPVRSGVGTIQLVGA